MLRGMANFFKALHVIESLKFDLNFQLATGWEIRNGNVRVTLAACTVVAARHPKRNGHSHFVDASFLGLHQASLLMRKFFITSPIYRLGVVATMVKSGFVTAQGHQHGADADYLILTLQHRKLFLCLMESAPLMLLVGHGSDEDY